LAKRLGPAAAAELMAKDEAQRKAKAESYRVAREVEKSRQREDAKEKTRMERESRAGSRAEEAAKLQRAALKAAVQGLEQENASAELVAVEQMVHDLQDDVAHMVEMVRQQAPEVADEISPEQWDATALRAVEGSEVIWSSGFADRDGMHTDTTSQQLSQMEGQALQAQAEVGDHLQSMVGPIVDNVITKATVNAQALVADIAGDRLAARSLVRGCVERVLSPKGQQH